MTHMSNNNKLAVITGGNGGIGTSIATTLADEGYIVGLGDLKDSVMQNAKEISRATSGNVYGESVDVTDPNSIHVFIDKMLNITGRNHIDVLINNAGITKDSLFSKMSYEQWVSVLNVNLNGAFNFTKEVIQGMIDNKYGRIINISSISRFGNKGQANYAASKAGLVGFTKTLATELGKFGITSNAVSPGIIDTEMIKTIPESIMQDFIKRIPERRVGRPEEVAYLVSFLASDKAAYITGEVININGGFFF